MCGPPLTQVRGWRGDQLMLQVGGRGEDWKVDGCSLVLGEHRGRALILRAPKIMGARPHPESTQNNGGVPSSCGRFGDSLLFFIAAKS